MANISELLNGWGFGKQTAIGTANLVATIWRHTNLNTKPWAKVPVNEDDRAEIGKGHEFPTQLFKSHYNMPAYELSKYASSEFLAWAMSFSMGNVVVSGSGRTRTPSFRHWERRTRPAWSCLLSFVQQIRPGGSAVLDEMLVGCAVKAGSSPSRTRLAAPVRCARWSASPPASTRRPAASRCRPSPRRMNSMPA